MRQLFAVPRRSLYEPSNGADLRGRLIPEIANIVPAIANGGISSDGRTVLFSYRAALIPMKASHSYVL